jgi:hypothetical protein
MKADAVETRSEVYAVRGADGSWVCRLHYPMLGVVELTPAAARDLSVRLSSAAARCEHENKGGL